MFSYLETQELPVGRLVFYHINKCAGTTLLYKLKDLFDHESCLYMEEFRSVKEFDDLGYVDYERIAKSRFIHESDLGRNWKDVLSNVTSFVMLRDPIDRLYSEWAMVHDWTDQEAVEAKDGKKVRDIARKGFGEFLRSKNDHVFNITWNCMTRKLLLGDRSTIHRWDNREGINSKKFAEHALRVALNNLEQIDHVGLVEQFDDSLSSLAILVPFLGQGASQIYNARGGRAYRHKIDAKTLGIATSITALDQVLYDAACRKFESQISRLRRTYGRDLWKAAGEAYRRQMVELPSWALISMGSGLRGSGWQAREVNGHKISRWIGPSRFARLDVPINKSNDMLVRVRCTNFLNEDQLSVLRMTADDQPLNVESWIYEGRYRYFEAPIAANALRNDPILQLGFDCGFVGPSPDPGDPRILGLEFAELEIGPISGFNRGRPGTPLTNK
jgi:hypothetical protein